MLETSGVGAEVDLTRIPAPPGVEPIRWLNAFPSFGFVLSVEPKHVDAVCERFARAGVDCRAVGQVLAGSRFELVSGEERALYWDLQLPLTGFGASGARAPAESGAM